MKTFNYTLQYHFGRKEYEVSFRAYDILDALEFAKAYCRQHGIVVAWVVSSSGRKYIV